MLTRQKGAASAPAAVSLLLVALWLPVHLFGQAQILAVHDGLPDFDSRAGSQLQPSSAQFSTASGLGATVRWNQFGTPQSMIKYGGYLASGLSSDPATAARSWIASNASLFKLSATGLQNLELVSDSPLVGSSGHVVLFRQHFGTLPATQDGLIAVGVVNGSIAYVSSSSAGDGNVPDAASLSPTDAWLRAADSVGRTVSAGEISGLSKVADATVFNVAGFAQRQRSRLVAFPTPDSGVRSAYETIVLDAKGGNPIAYKIFVDAQSGDVLFRQNAVNRLAQTDPFTGSYNPTSCGTPQTDFTVPAGTKTIDVVVSATVVSNDIAVSLWFGGHVVGSSDVATSPEVIHYAPAAVTPGTYSVQVCESAAPLGPDIAPDTYAGTFTTNDTAVATFPPYPPEWSAFPANPPLDYSDTDTRQLWCWESSVNGVPIPGCQRSLINLASRSPWDFNVRANVPTFTTLGNNASSAEAWISPLTPAEQNRPISLARQYSFPWTNAWYTSKCNPTNLTPGGNDIQAAVANLFSMHNRMHDFSYFLGFTEQNGNLQDSNFGNTAPGPYPAGRENDPELGDAEAGAVDGGYPSYEGRDNANQIALNDGIPGITNMYLWQPIAAAFYPPCVDGDYDMSVMGHEYTHAISNRMIGGPDASITGQQGGSMGEGWSDLDAMEYLNEYHLVPTGGENPYSVGAYVTGNKARGIRNYVMSSSPLNYSNIGYDTPGPEVHADGEIWITVNFDIRQALVNKYNASYPATNTTLQQNCADGKLPANQCPGNRRWIQIMYDAFLLEPASVSMLDARDAYLAADLMRFGGANQKELWHAFAQRGFGVNASTTSGDDVAPLPNFQSSLETLATITFKAVAINESSAPVNAQIFVGDFEARSRPIANTGGSPLSATAMFVPGTYDFIAQAPGYGLMKFTRTLIAGTATLTIGLPTNWASQSKGALAVAWSTASTATTDAASNVNDDTENTDWSGIGQLTASQFVTVTFPALHSISRVNVSALITPGQNRFSALRKFKVQASTDGVLFHDVYASVDNAFPGDVPRPTAPDMILRTFTLPSATTAKALRLVALTNQCQGGPGFQGNTNNDPTNNPDCTTGNATVADLVSVAEFQAFSTAGSASGGGTTGGGGGSGGSGSGCGDDDLALVGPLSAAAGDSLQYTVTLNSGMSGDTGCRVKCKLPKNLTFTSASDGGAYDGTYITWTLGAVPAITAVPLTFTAEVAPGTAAGTVLTNQVSIDGWPLAPTAVLDTSVLP